MRIAMDASPILKELTGIGTYTHRLLEAMAPLAATDRFIVWTNGLRGCLPGGGDWAYSPGLIRKRTRIPGKLLLAWWRRFPRPTVEDLIGDIDLLHSPNFFFHPHRRGTRTVATIHDLFFLRHPEKAEKYGGKYFRDMLGEYAPEIDHFIAVSHATAHDLEAAYGIDADRITVIHHGVDPAFFECPEGFPAVLAGKFGLDRPYFLSVGTIEPRKNYAFLIRAFDRWRRMSKEDHLLVIAGRPGWGLEDVKRAIRDLGSPPWLRMPGYVDRRDLRGLYHHCRGLLLTTRLEGFCLPALESMAAGAPVVAPDLPVLREVLGDAGLFFEGGDVEAFLEGMTALSEREEEGAQRARRGRDRARTFTWEKAARSTWQVYRRVLGIA